MRRDLFGAKTPSSERGCESPLNSDTSSLDYNFIQMGTPIHPEQNYPLNDCFKNNDGNNQPEILKYINNEINQGSKESQNFVNYQYSHNLFSPFDQVRSIQTREPLGSIPPFSVQRKLTFTQCVKENRKDFSFVYGEKNSKVR